MISTIYLHVQPSGPLKDVLEAVTGAVPTDYPVGLSDTPPIRLNRKVELHKIVIFRDKVSVHVNVREQGGGPHAMYGWEGYTLIASTSAGHHTGFTFTGHGDMRVLNKQVRHYCLFSYVVQ